ncbi:MAG: hypothetical protein IPM37_15510 [Hahellaceae bacterium]|nr:hypothetical protein [Hahellaceae bacterium]
MIEDTLWIALAVFNGPFMFSLLWVLALRCEAPWTAWRPCRWLASLCEAWLWWGPLHMGFFLGLTAWLQGWAIAHRVAAVCLLLWWCNGLILRITRPSPVF